MRKFLIAGLLALSLFVPTAASAQVYVQTPGNTPELPGNDTGGETKVLGRQYDRAENDLGFALTGSDMTGLAIIGILLVGGGYVLVKMRRSGSAPTTA